MGIILFNGLIINATFDIHMFTSFRPLMGIILFNIIGGLHTIIITLALMFPSPNGDYFI